MSDHEPPMMNRSYSYRGGDHYAPCWAHARIDCSSLEAAERLRSHRGMVAAWPQEVGHVAVPQGTSWPPRSERQGRGTALISS
jgi:hypothetical protein